MTRSIPGDRMGRPMRNLRLSVTDRCNLRCGYCMPEENYVWLPRRDLLHFGEMRELVRVFVGLGVSRLRLTGGEPLLRKELPRLVGMLAAIPGVEDLALTTNGVRLGEQAAALRAAGLHRVTVSLDTLRADRFRELTRRDFLSAVLAGIDAARVAGFSGVKLDTVVIRGRNDDEICDLVDYARGIGAEIRFIEYMDVGGATRWSIDQVVSRSEILDRVGHRFGKIEALREESSAPAERFRLEDGTVFGVIASTTAPFCQSCDRSRLTADGMWYLCLYARGGMNLRDLLRGGADNAEIGRRIRAGWIERRERGAEERLGDARRGALARHEELRGDPHLEMHTRGG